MVGRQPTSWRVFLWWGVEEESDPLAGYEEQDSKERVYRLLWYNKLNRMNPQLVRTLGQTEGHAPD